MRPGLRSRGSEGMRSSTESSDLRTSTIQGKQQVFQKKMTKVHVELVTDKKVRSRCKWVLLATAFINLSGSVLLAGSFPMMCANTPGATPMGDVPGAFPARDFAAAKPTGPPALDYAMAINLILVVQNLGAVFSNYLAGVASDKIGRKIVIQGCLLGGILSYVLMFISGYWVHNYWCFLGANFVNGLFSGIRGVISAYLQDIHEPAEFISEVMPTMVNCFLFGAMGGSVLGLCWVALANSDPSLKNSAFSLFGACWLGVLLSGIAVIIVHVYCPEPAKKGDKEEDGGKKAPPPSTSEAWSTWQVVAIILIAGSFDTFGDTGNRFARNTILTNRYERARRPVVNYALMASNIISIFIGQQIVMKTIKRRGFMQATGLWCILGNVASSVVQFALLAIINFDTQQTAMEVFICVWLISQIFGFCSTLAAMFLMPAFVPPQRRGQINGFRNSLQAFINSVAPVALALVYQTGSMATVDRQAAVDRAGIICLGTCGAISALAFIGYLPILRFLPKPPPKIDGDAQEGKELEVPRPLDYYDNVTWEEWSLLSLELRMKIQRMRSQKGMEQVMLPWSTWHADREIAGVILETAPSELADLRRFHTRMMANDESLRQLMEMNSKYRQGLVQNEANRARHDRNKAEMGRWIVEYLDNAGYDSWELMPYLYKAMIMAAFPPIDTLDEQVDEVQTVQDERDILLRFIRVLDLHTKTAEITSTDVAFTAYAGGSDDFGHSAAHHF